MPPKSKKNQSLWHKCENCSYILNYKDLDIHIEYCQQSNSERPYGFIDNFVLYSFIDDFSSKEILPPSCDNYAMDLVFLSQSAMQLCGFSIGYPLLVETSQYTTVLKAWPTVEGSLTSVGMCIEDMEMRSGLKLDSNRVKVSKLPVKPLIANEVYFNIVLINDDDIPNIESEIPHLSYRFKDKVLHSNMFLMIPFYGKKVKLKINKVYHIEEDIAYSFQQMNLNIVFYTITENTVWINEEIKKEVKTKEINPLKIGGYDSLINELTQNIHYTLKQKFNCKEQFCSPYCVLLYGQSGSGKSYIAQYLTNITQKPCINIQGSELFSKFYGETENRLRMIFQEIKSKVPCVVLMDNIETLGSKKGSDQERRVLSTLLSLFDSIRSLPVVIIATTVDPDLLDPALRRPGRLETEIEINIPDKVDRFKILKSLIPDVEHVSKLEEIAEHCHGYVAADLVSLVDKTLSKALMNTSERNISAEDLIWAFTQVRPSAMRELQVHVPAVKWSDIGGGQEVRLKLEQAVEWPLKHGESLKRLGIKAPKGVLLYGPPGCSKTLLAKALATETNLNFISIKGSDIFSKWVGESEKALRDLFRSARKVAPAIIFLDEIDALGANRGSSMGNTVHERVLSQLLTEMDGVNPLDGVVIVAATNRPDCIDKALLRPGRLDRLIYVPLPDYETRMQILKIQFEKVPTRNVLIEEIAKRTEGYSGAEFSKLFLGFPDLS
ncbi:ATPase family gene 2 protein homolog A isoform X2 [Halyomorpha halys]|uniref:ATPase family gene 2 protein homolog A isoform X2 n=1 Tax=Halyomorpha halys TaxID=286706 RepID=UPI0034D385FA